MHTSNIQVCRGGCEPVASPSSPRRSPLHFASAVEDFLESTYALLQRGARVYQKDALGVRSFDLKNVSVVLCSICRIVCVLYIHTMYNSGPLMRVPALYA